LAILAVLFGIVLLWQDSSYSSVTQVRRLC